jgi:hypothetical protein
VLPIPNSLYAQWRLESGAIPFLHEPGELPPERLLQAVWQHQRLARDRLTCLDGQTVRILHPGFASREGGPDFRAAVLQFDHQAPRSGDIEVDVHAGGWTAHRHDRNPAFRNVILHVIWHGERPAEGVPATLVLREQLDAPIGELALRLNTELEPGLPELWRGRCCRALGGLSAAHRGELLRDAADIRFRAKAERIQSRARQAGWDQALWEGLFRALGYKHNGWPMQCLAEQRPRWLAAELESPLELQARLLGIANLLPAELTRSRTSADRYLRRVWDLWWRERESFEDIRLPSGLWRLGGQRPANHPQRRLALVSHWLAAGDLPGRIERWCAAAIPENRLARSLLEVLQAPADPFWSWHWTIGSARMKRPQPLLGPARVTDLAVNVVLPWLWIRAVEGDNRRVRQTIESRYRAWPAAEDNSALRFARDRLMGGAPRSLFRFAVEQQGCLQIGRDFCDRSDSLCTACRFPEWARQYGVDPGDGSKARST